MPPPPPSSSNYFSSIGLGYSIAIALGFLILFSSLLLASYICLRASRNRSRNQNNNNNNNNNNPTSSSTTISDDGGIILPRIIFVAEGDDDNEDESNQNLVVGLDENVINSYPKFVYTKYSSGSAGGFTGNTISNCNSNSNHSNNNNSNSTMCSICLCEYKDLEMLRMMPECRHYFHLCCLDAWLRLNGSCPVCRNSPLPTPLSTPLSEVVPLSQYGEDRRRRRR